MSRQVHLAVNILGAGVFGGSWRFPGTDPEASFRLDHYLDIARKAEAAKFDAIFLADGPAVADDVRYRPFNSLEPSVVLAAVAAATTAIGLIGTLSSSYNDPYDVARRFATLDHLSGGRSGWNVVTTAGRSAARNFGFDDAPDHAVRYARAAEFVEVVRKLWNSWEPDALVGDKGSRRFADTGKIHRTDHHGPHLDVAGPLNVPRSPQGEPVIVQAGASTDGRALAAHVGEVVFTAARTEEEAGEYYRDVKARADGLGRSADGVVILPGLSTVIGSTEAEARRRRDLLAELVPPELDSGAGHRIVTGTPEQIADAIVDWVDKGVADGFNLMPDVLPGGFDDFTEHVVPILQRRGRFRTEYRSTTLRGHLGLAVPSHSVPAGRDAGQRVVA
ncbi:NtaA/DmoA family FMN-dependent monooxygenase [Rhodococcus sp. NPDC003318]|uniref:NtaA/DmoA family FMN-dependent monooxygenase n=1 Tax=Rhodococcus sp. NPDC003318 TaxID=3364503 RepID=UPI0036B4D838